MDDDAPGATTTAASAVDLLLALTGCTALIELDVIEPRDALAAVEVHLDRLSSGT